MSSASEGSVANGSTADVMARDGLPPHENLRSCANGVRKGTNVTRNEQTESDGASPSGTTVAPHPFGMQARAAIAASTRTRKAPSVFGRDAQLREMMKRSGSTTARSPGSSPREDET